MIAKRKGVAVRRGLKEAWSKGASRWTRTGLEAYDAGRAGKGRRSPLHQRASYVNSAVVHRRMSSLPREISRLSQITTKDGAIHPDRSERSQQRAKYPREWGRPERSSARRVMGAANRRRDS